MKNTLFRSVLVATAFAVFMSSCVRETLAPEEVCTTPSVTINASIADMSTKVDFTPSYDGTYGKPQSLALAWAEGDKLRIYNHADRSQYSDFDLADESIGQKAGKFVGTLVSATSYDVEIINGDFEYANQTQPSDGVTTGLKYLASACNLTDVKNIEFTDFSSVLAITVQMPSKAIAAKVKSVDIISNSNIFAGGKNLSVSFSSIGDADNDGLLHFFATLPPGDQAIAKGTTLLVKLNAPGEEHNVYTRFIEFSAAKTFTHNKLNTINISAANSASYANTSSTNIGTEDNPYLIGDKYQMQAMHTSLVNDSKKYYKMVDDVDLDGETWVPLCLSADEKKEIHFNGGGHTISNLTVGSANNYPSFVGFLNGEVENVVFDHATITCGNVKEQSAGVVSGYIGGSGYQGNCYSVTIRNSSVTSAGGAAFAGGLGARVGKGGEFRDCHVINTSISTSNNGTSVGGLLAYIASNSTIVISDCSAEDITVTGYGHYAAGLVACIVSNNPVTILRCHTTGEIKRSASGRHFGGLVGSIQSADVLIKDCYSTCSVIGSQWSAGLVGSWWSSTNFTGGSGKIDHCFASGNVTDKGNSGDGGLVGSLEVPGVTITNSIAWNSSIVANKHDEDNYSSGAVVGRAHPNSILLNNYRNPAMNLTAFWVPSSNFDHPDSKKSGDKYYIWKIGVDKNEANGDYTTATTLSAPLGTWAYHGKHLSSGITVSPDNERGFTSSAPIPGIDDTPASDPENPSYSGNNVWAMGTTEDIVEGVQWTHFHGPWEGSIREISIITTTLNEHNRLGIYHNYTDEGKKYLNEKCQYVDAVAGTNGSMTSQFIRVNNKNQRLGDDSKPEWERNCALTLDNGVVDIIKVDNNADAATLPNATVSCAGPLLVWKGNKLTVSSEWESADNDKWLTTTHPRTAIGINKEGTKVIQVAVDGRWANDDDAKKAEGMRIDLLAELMLQLGCYKAMNLDGGGGTQMWVYGKGDIHNIVNHPHNSWPTYESESNTYYWIHNGEVGRRTCCSAVYVYSDLK